MHPPPGTRVPERPQESNRRIYIIGGPGSGKTTLARLLSTRMKLPMHSLDAIAYEGPSFTQRRLANKMRDIHHISCQSEWIVEGMHIGWTDELLETADLIIWLDHLPWYLALVRIVLRFVRGSIRDVRQRQGRQKFTRFADYARHLRQLIYVLASSTRYYRSSSKPRSESLSGPTVTRASTADRLIGYTDKVIRCKATQTAETIIEDISIEQIVRREAGSMVCDPLVSIVINNYNYGRFLRQAIESALSQRYPYIEVIIVDDGSSDDSCAIIHNYRDRVIEVFKQNGGQASAFNAGFEHSSGDIVIFLDADDVLLPSAVKGVVSAFYTWPRSAKVQYRMAIIDEQGQITSQVKPPPHLSLKSGNLIREVLSFPDDMTFMATSGNAFPAWLLRKLMPMPEQPFMILADLYVSHLSVLYGRVTSIDEIGAYYRVHSSNSHDTSTLDLEKLRSAINHMSVMHRYIRDQADTLGFLEVMKQRRDISSITFYGHRLASLRLDPSHHPFRGDTVANLAVGGIAVSFARFDVLLPMKLLFICWFLAMAVAPKWLAFWLAERFLYVETRGRINEVLALFHGKDLRTRPDTW